MAEQQLKTADQINIQQTGSIKTAVKVEELTGLELIEDRLEHVANGIGTVYATADMLFQKIDKSHDEEDYIPTPDMLLLTNLGAMAAIMTIFCHRMQAAVEVLRDLESEEKNG